MPNAVPTGMRRRRLGPERLPRDAYGSVNSFSNGPLVANQPTGTPWPAPPHQAAGWPFQLLPYVEQNAAQNQAGGHIRNTGLPSSSALRGGRRAIKLTAAAAPGRRSPLDYATPYFGPVSRDANTVRNTEASFFGIIVPAEPPEANRGRSDMVVRMASITDGTSNTLLLGEKWLRPDQYLTGAWMDDHNFASSPRSGRHSDRRPAAAQGHEQQPDDRSARRAGRQQPLLRLLARRAQSLALAAAGQLFRRRHPGGMSCLLADGSVRGINWTISKAAFASFGNKQDGISFSLD